MPVDDAQVLNLLELHARELFLVLEHVMARAGKPPQALTPGSVYWPECQAPFGALQPADVPEFLSALARVLNEVARRLSL